MDIYKDIGGIIARTTPKIKVEHHLKIELPKIIFFYFYFYHL